MSESSDAVDHQVKLLVVGESGVGKTNIILRFCQNSFISSYLSTIGIDLKVKSILINNKKLKLQIWDTAGQQRFRTITQTYYRGAMGIILVYSVTDRQSFESIRRWYNEAQEYTGEKAIKILVGNKADSQRRVVSEEEGRNLAKQIGIPFYETSAKNDLNIQTSFRELATLINKKMLNLEKSVKVATYTGSKIMRKQVLEKNKQKCC